MFGDHYEIDPVNRPAAAKVYTDYRSPFLEKIPGDLTKNLLVRNEDVQVLHVFVGLKSLWDADPDMKIYAVTRFDYANSSPDLIQGRRF